MEDFRNARGWAMVGTTGLFEYLNDRRRDVVHEFAQEHPVHLPVFPELGDTPPPPPSPSVDHTTALGLGEGDVDMGTGTDSSPIVRLNTFTDTPLT